MISGWKEEIQSEYLDFIRSHHTLTPRDLAVHFKTSEDLAVYWLTDLARDGRIRILAIASVDKTQTRREVEASAGSHHTVFLTVSTKGTDLPDPRRLEETGANGRVEAGGLALCQSVDEK